MNANAFDAITRRTADAVSRRRSLFTIGGATLGATLAAPLAAEAKRGKKKCKKKCKKQVEQCEDQVRQFCNQFDQEPAQECRDELLPCCEPLGNCKAAASTECFLDHLIFVIN